MSFIRESGPVVGLEEADCRAFLPSRGRLCGSLHAGRSSAGELRDLAGKQAMCKVRRGKGRLGNVQLPFRRKLRQLSAEMCEN